MNLDTNGNDFLPSSPTLNNSAFKYLYSGGDSDMNIYRVISATHNVVEFVDTFMLRQMVVHISLIMLELELQTQVIYSMLKMVQMVLLHLLLLI